MHTTAWEDTNNVDTGVNDLFCFNSQYFMSPLLPHDSICGLLFMIVSLTDHIVPESPCALA